MEHLDNKIKEAVDTSEFRIIGLTLSPRNESTLQGVKEDVLHILNKKIDKEGISFTTEGKE
jgi:hypothetical protein